MTEKSELELLRSFAQAIIKEWENDKIDSDNLEEIAVHYGIYTRVPVTHPCADGCACHEFYGEAPWRDGMAFCARRTRLLSGNKKPRHP